MLVHLNQERSHDFDLEVQNLNQIFFFHYRIINTQNFKTKLIHQK